VRNLFVRLSIVCEKISWMGGEGDYIGNLLVKFFDSSLFLRVLRCMNGRDYFWRDLWFKVSSFGGW